MQSPHCARLVFERACKRSSQLYGEMKLNRMLCGRCRLCLIDGAGEVVHTTVPTLCPHPPPGPLAFSPRLIEWSVRRSIEGAGVADGSNRLEIGRAGNGGSKMVILESRTRENKEQKEVENDGKTSSDVIRQVDGGS